MSLQSLCRLTIRKSLGLNNINKIDELGLVPPFDDFVAFREIFISSCGQRHFETHALTILKLNKVLKEVSKDPIVRGVYENCLASQLIKKIEAGEFFEPPEQIEEPEVESVALVAPPVPVQPPQRQEGAAPPPPPPPPPAPMPPRPGFWRFPGAEFSNKGLRR